MDLAPGMEALTKYLDATSSDGPNPYRDPDVTYNATTGTKVEHGQAAVYRNMVYVKAEVESMARQLKEIADGRA